MRLSKQLVGEFQARITKYEASAQFNEERAAELRQEADGYERDARGMRAQSRELQRLVQLSAPGYERCPECGVDVAATSPDCITDYHRG